MAQTGIKFYKELARCKSCKKMFPVDKEKSYSRTYCSQCKKILKIDNVGY